MAIKIVPDEKYFLISISIFFHQIYIDYLEKINYVLLPSTLLDPEVTNTLREQNMIEGFNTKLGLS